jgi:hypothetical protein
MIGVHFRGTDKGSEARRIEIDEVVSSIRRKARPDSVLFVASDENAFVEHLMAQGLGLKIVSADHARSQDHRALHFDPRHAGFRHAEEALMDSLLLSKCAVLIKTPSALSAWSKVFNPGLEVVLIGRAFDHVQFFPEKALHRAAN